MLIAFDDATINYYFEWEQTEKQKGSNMPGKTVLMYSFGNCIIAAV